MFCRQNYHHAVDKTFDEVFIRHMVFFEGDEKSYCTKCHGVFEIRKSTHKLCYGPESVVVRSTMLKSKMRTL